MTTGVALTGGVFCFAIISDETEAIEKHTKRTAELLKDFGGGTAQTFR